MPIIEPGVFGPFKGKWEAWSINDYKRGEVSVIRKDNRHGHISYGWGDIDEKIIIYSPCYEDEDLIEGNCAKEVWERMQRAAKEMAKFLNKEDKRGVLRHKKK